MKRLIRSFRRRLGSLPEFRYSKHGHCPCCNDDTTFYAENTWLRDSLVCIKCGCLPRERGLVRVIEKWYPNWQHLAIHESSPVLRGASKKLKQECPLYTASQYFPHEPFRKIVEGFNNQNLENLTFDSNSFDLFITQDVMEHIYHPSKAFSEIERVLKPGGAHIFTVPLYNKHFPSEVWATLGENGKPHFLKQPEYHGNPVDSEGSPVTIHWGFDIKEFIDQSGRTKTYIEHPYNLDEGIWAEFIEVVVTKKLPVA